MSTLFDWTGTVGPNWDSVTTSGTNIITNWRQVPSGKVDTVPTSDTRDVAEWIDGGIHTVSGGGSADQFTLNNSTTVTFTGDRFEAGAFEPANNAEFPDDLVIDDGSKLVVAGGAGLQNQGTVDVVGLGNDLFGGSGDGSLEVDSGGIYTTQALIIGDGTAGNGVVTINGALEFDVVTPGNLGVGDGALTIGQMGKGSLTVSATPAVFTQSATLGLNQGAVGSMSLDSSTWGGGNSTLGAAGVGHMTIGAGATVALFSLILGSAETGSGDLTVTGANSFMVDFLTIGQAGTGTATFGPGSNGTFAAVIVGDSVGAIADMTMDGATWNASTLTIGFTGTGHATAGAGEVVTVSVDGILGAGAEAVGGLTIDAAALNGGTVSVGENGTGVLAIESGSTGSVAAVIVGENADSSGTLTIDSSNWNVGSLTVGQTGAGQATVGTGATVTLDNILIGANGTLAVTETAGSVGTVIAQQVTIGFGTLDLSAFGQMLIGATAGTNGAVAIGNKASLTGLGSLKGDVVLSDGGQVLATAPVPGALTIDGAITGDGTIKPLMTLEANGVIDTGVTIGFSPSIGAQVGDLVIDVPAGEKGTIVGFSAGNTIDVQGSLYTNAVFTQGTSGAAGTLTLSGVGYVPLALAVEGDYSPDSFVATPGTSDTIVTLCFVAGTRIATPQGEVPVERLAIGDKVLTLNGIASRLSGEPIRWIGHRRIDLTAHPRPETVMPIRIEHDAFAYNMPHRDLLVSPDHAIFVDGKLICAKQLVNGITIRRETGLSSVDYYHVELNEHAILLAEGLPAESYLDTGNRGFFANAGAPLVLHPDLTDDTEHPTREVGSCAPFVWDEANVRPVWQRLADRAGASQRVTTTNADPRLVVDQRTIKPVFSDSEHVIFMVPRGASDVRLVSRAQSPTEARPWLSDQRRLGVRVKRIVLRDGDETREIPMDHPDVTRGWWDIEHDGPMMSRWTDGEALLPLPPMLGPALLEVHLAGTTTYAVDATPDGVVERRSA